VTVFSDYICPFCYVGDARLEHLRDDYDLRVEWSYFEIHPENPATGRPVEELGYAPEVWARMMSNLEAMAAEEGLALAERRFTTNSHRALLLAEAAKAGDSRVFERVHKRLFTAYFADRMNIGDDAVLRRIAAECGLAESLCDQAWADSELERGLARQAQRAAALGIGGVPAFLIGGYLVQGAVPVSTLRQAAVLASRRADTREDPT